MEPQLRRGNQETVGTAGRHDFNSGERLVKGVNECGGTQPAVAKAQQQAGWRRTLQPHADAIDGGAGWVEAPQLEPKRGRCCRHGGAEARHRLAGQHVVESSAARHLLRFRAVAQFHDRHRRHRLNERWRDHGQRRHRHFGSQILDHDSQARRKKGSALHDPFHTWISRAAWPDVQLSGEFRVGLREFTTVRPKRFKLSDIDIDELLVNHQATALQPFTIIHQRIAALTHARPRPPPLRHSARRRSEATICAS